MGVKTRTPNKTPRRIVAKPSNKSKPQTPEFKRILERIRNKRSLKLEKPKLDENRTPESKQSRMQKTKSVMQENVITEEEHNTKKICNLEVESVNMDGPPKQPLPPKLWGGSRKKGRGTKLDYVEDRNQLKLVDLWELKMKRLKKGPDKPKN